MTAAKARAMRVAFLLGLAVVGCGADRGPDADQRGGVTGRANTCEGHAAPLPRAIAEAGYVVVWCDDFEDPASVNVYGTDPADTSSRRWMGRIWYENGPEPGQISVESGVLVLKRARDQKDVHVSSYNPDIGRGKTFHRGYFEARLRFHGGYRGNWPAFWLLSKTSPRRDDPGLTPEFDIVELYGDTVRDFTGTAHLNTGNGAPPDACQTDRTGICDRTSAGAYKTAFLPRGKTWFDGEWHVFGGLWTDTTLEWWIDGVKVNTWDISRQPWATSFSDEMFVILNIGNGNATEGGTRALSGSTVYQMDVDYVVVYQKPSPK
jgi:hypothetical protein